MRRALAVLATALLLTACGSGQDPGVDPQPSGERGATTTPALLQPCPPGGPDATTPPAGCVGEDGEVRQR